MGRTAGNMERKYQLVTIQERHHQILRMLALGHVAKDIAEILGCTTATVSNVQHGELGKRQLSLYRSAADKEAVDVAAEIRRLAPIALAKVEELLIDSKTDPKLVANISQDLLDRAGHGAPKIIQGQFVHTYLTKDQIEELKKRAESITAIEEDVIEGEYNEL